MKIIFLDFFYFDINILKSFKNISLMFSQKKIILKNSL
jgi:hypothetical protein